MPSFSKGDEVLTCDFIVSTVPPDGFGRERVSPKCHQNKIIDDASASIGGKLDWAMWRASPRRKHEHKTNAAVP